MAKITFLGTSSSIPTKTRDNTSFLFEYKKDIFLIDCPGSLRQKFLKLGVPYKKVNRIIITHQHLDHIYGIISFIHSQGYLNTGTITIYSNPDCIRLVKKLINLFNLTRPQFPKIRYRNAFKSSLFFKKPGLTLKAIRNKHIKDSFGVKFVFGSKSLFYSSDTSFSAKTLKEAGNFNYLIHDCTASSSYFKRYPLLYRMHTNAGELSKFLEDKPKIKLIPIHFLLLEKNEEKKIQAEFKAFKKQVIFAKDFEKLSL
tara:strand:- start:919 stop:1686 length:768 start_codon:yes stop_codon:yes gene_type:complete